MSSSLDVCPTELVQSVVDGIGMGIDSDRLENMRVSASKSTPMQDTLDLCSRYVDSTTIAMLVPKLVEIIRRGEFSSIVLP